MDNTNNEEYFDLNFLNFKKINIPQPTENKTTDDNYVSWGSDNLYPDFLLKLYSESAIHGGYINSKASYILGDGLRIKGGQKVNDIKVNATDTLYDFVRKLILDFEIFNALSTEVQYNAANEPIYYNHTPLQQVRTNRLKDRFWCSKEWLFRKDIIKYDRFTPYASDAESKIFYYDGYAPTINNVYTTPDYSRAIKSILTDISISEFSLNQIKTQFSVSTLINYYTGDPTEDVKRKILKQLNEMYSGESGERLLVSFNSPTSHKPEVQSLGAGDWANNFIELSKSVDDKINKAHSITSPLLFGNKEQGQLGGSTELETAYEIFSNTYVRNRRNELLSALNQLFKNSTLITGELEFIDKPLFQNRTSDELKEKIFTINELRKEAGLSPIEGYDKLLSEMNTAPAFSLINTTEPDKKKDEPVTKNKGKKLSEEDYELIKELGRNKDDFEVIHDHEFSLQFNKKNDIAEYIIDHDMSQLTVQQIVEILEKDGINTTQTELSKILQDLQKSGVIKIENNENNTISIKPPVQGKVADTDEIQVVYDYVKKPSVSGAEVIDTTRGFCRKLCNSNRYYTREDIQSMSGIFGYDVFQFTGGFWYEPETDITHNSCRHMWQRVAVKLK